ncbi:MAG: response regulator [Flavobacteriales bacterium]|nr:response regulator [Flavobacteriales bacterium]
MIRVLYVEDDKINRLVLDRYLHEDFDVTMAASSGDALKLMQEREFDVVLLDIKLGIDDLDGIALLKQMRQEFPSVDSRFIAVTAFAGSGEEQEIIKVGFDAYHAKPVDKRSLIDQIKAENAKRSH